MAQVAKGDFESEQEFKCLTNHAETRPAELLNGGTFSYVAAAVFPP